MVQVLPRTGSIVLLLVLAGCSSLLGLDDYEDNPEQASAGRGGGGSGDGGASGGAANACPPRMGQGGCAALGSDQNCAYCRNDCLNGSCMAGACSAGKVGTIAGFGLVGDDTHLFFRPEGDDTVYRVAITALDMVAPEPIASSLTDVWALLIAEPHLYVSASANIMRMEKSGAAPEVIATIAPPENRPNAMLVDRGYLYYTGSYAPGLRRISLMGAFPAPELVVADVGAAAGLAEDADTLYFASMGDSGASNGAILYFSKSLAGQSTQAHAVAENIESPVHLVAVGDDLYFSTGTLVMRVPKSGGAPVLVMAFARTIAALDSDGCELFVAAGDNDLSGEVWAMGLDGQGAVRLNSGVNLLRSGIRGSRDAVFHGGLSGIYRIMR